MLQVARTAVMKKHPIFPENGISSAVLSEKLQKHKTGDAKWSQGKTFGFVYHPGNHYARISEEYLNAFLYESTLNPSAFPSLRRFEKDIVAMARELMHGGDHISGNITSGGTESIFLALKVARDKAREERGESDRYEVILPDTAHPAFLKACHYLSLKAVVVSTDKGGQVDPEAMERAITESTILMAASAPCFPYGVVDPVPELARIARKHHLLFHVDACMGGFMLPFLEELEYPVPGFDFRIEGVTSISLDAHKYGYAPKGVSIILYRNRKLRRKQFFVHTEWPGGIFASTTFMGTKSGGPLAGCWAVMNHLGKEGYRTIARQVMETTLTIRNGIEEMEGLSILGKPQMSLFAFTSARGDIYNIGDALSAKGWHLDRLQFPEAIHVTVTQLNIGMAEQFLHDLREIISREYSLCRERKATRKSVRWVNRITAILPRSVTDKVTRMAGSKMGCGYGNKQGSQAALYGISASLGNRKNVSRLVLNLLDGMF